MAREKIRQFAAVMAFVAVTTVLSGCYGQFGLVKALYKVNGSVQNIWARSGVTALLVIIPVYEFAGLGDVIIVNPIEFWSHVNPITNKPSVSSARTQGPGADPTKNPDGWLTQTTKAGKKVLLAWHYDARSHQLNAIGISKNGTGAGKPEVTLYRSSYTSAGRLDAGPRVAAVTFHDGLPTTRVSGAGSLEASAGL
jgi:hypothetical protein